MSLQLPGLATVTACCLVVFLFCFLVFVMPGIRGGRRGRRGRRAGATPYTRASTSSRRAHSAPSDATPILLPEDSTVATMSLEHLMDAVGVRVRQEMRPLLAPRPPPHLHYNPHRWHHSLLHLSLVSLVTVQIDKILGGHH